MVQLFGAIFDQDSTGGFIYADAEHARLTFKKSLQGSGGTDIPQDSGHIPPLTTWCTRTYLGCGMTGGEGDVR